MSNISRATVGPGGRWAPVVSVLVDAFSENPFDVNGEASLAEFAQAVQASGCAVVLDWNASWQLQDACRRVHDWRVGWSDDSMALADLEQLAFTWDAETELGGVHGGLVAFDQHLQQLDTDKRLVAVDTNADFYASFLIPAERAGALITAFGQCNITAYLQDDHKSN